MAIHPLSSVVNFVWKPSDSIVDSSLIVRSPCLLPLSRPPSPGQEEGVPLQEKNFKYLNKRQDYKSCLSFFSSDIESNITTTQLRLTCEKIDNKSLSFHISGNIYQIVEVEGYFIVICIKDKKPFLYLYDIERGVRCGSTELLINAEMQPEKIFDRVYVERIENVIFFSAKNYDQLIILNVANKTIVCSAKSLGSEVLFTSNEAIFKNSAKREICVFDASRDKIVLVIPYLEKETLSMLVHKRRLVIEKIMPKLLIEKNVNDNESKENEITQTFSGVLELYNLDSLNVLYHQEFPHYRRVKYSEIVEGNLLLSLADVKYQLCLSLNDGQTIKIYD